MNPVNWFEIAVTDMDRAVQFYEYVFEVKLHVNQMGPLQMAMFPMNPESPGATGALVYHPDFYKPSNEKGSLLYFTCSDVAITLDRIREKNGEILVEKKLIAEGAGYMGLFIDSEGNRMALHSNA